MLRRALAVLTVVAAVAVVYRDAIPAYFFEDDFQWLVSGWAFRPASLLDLSDRNHFYRPIIELYFWIATPLFDNSPRLFHLANVGLHLANGLLVFLVARALGARDRWAFVAALFFVVQPSDIEAIAWVSALAEPVGAFFGSTSIYAFLRFRRSGRARWYALSIAAFFLALMTHESSVVFFPLMALADWTISGRTDLQIARQPRALLETVKPYWPFAALLAGYLAVDLSVNRRHYLVEEGHYRLGFHAIRNIFSYIVSLYVGKRNILSYVVIAVALVGLLMRGTPRARFATLWVLIALLPFSFFTWASTSRYLYLPAVGFALLLAEGIGWLDTWLTGRVRPSARHVALAVVVAGLAIRFSVFAVEGVANFAHRTDAYRDFIVSFRRAHLQLADHSAVPLDPTIEKALHHRYLEALVQWEYRNPTIRLVVSGQ